MERLALPVLAVVAGVVSFSSPCCLPLVPGYLYDVSALPVSELDGAGGRRVRVRASLLLVRRRPFRHRSLAAAVPDSPTLVRRAGVAAAVSPRHGDSPGADAGVAATANPLPDLLRRCPRPLAVVAVAILAAALLVGCGDDGPADAHDPYAEMEQGLRRARERAGAADPEGARREFFDVAHDALHRLAAEVAEGDRAGAA